MKLHPIGDQRAAAHLDRRRRQHGEMQQRRGQSLEVRGVREEGEDLCALAGDQLLALEHPDPARLAPRILGAAHA